MSLSQAATEFLTGRPAGVSAVSRSAGLLTRWVENGFNCTVRRDSAGLPYELVAERAGRGLRLTQSFTYSGGVLIGMTGDTIPTVFREEVMGGQAPVSGAGTGPTTRAPYPLRKWQRALARVQAGLGNAVIACAGDSTTAGVFANGSTDWPGNKAKSYPTALAAALTSYAGITTGIGSVTSDNSTAGHAGTVPSFDPRVAFGANWTSGALLVPGGQSINNTAGALGAAAAETMTFTPAASFDTVVVTWFRNTSIGTFTIDCGGGVLATCPAGAKSVQRTTVSKAAGTGVVNIIRTVTPGVYIMGIETYLSTAKQVSVLNFGWSGGKAMITNSWGDASDVMTPSTALTQFAPDLTIINLGINDAIAGNSQAVISAGLTNLVTNAQLTGDVLFVIPPYPDVTVASAASMAIVAAAIAEVSAAKSVPVLDLNARWGGYATSPTLFHTDKMHPIQLGYQDMAQAISAVLLS